MMFTPSTVVAYAVYRLKLPLNNWNIPNGRPDNDIPISQLIFYSI